MNRTGTWRDFDFMLAGSVLALLALGATVLFSASYDTTTGQAGHLFTQHVLYIVLGLGVMIGCTLMDYRTIGQARWVIYASGLFLIVGVKLLGHTSLGAQRWILLGPFEFQPSEFEKLALIGVLAHYFATRQGKPITLSVYARSLALVGLPFVLVLLQPDLGTAIVFAALFVALAWASGVPKRFLGGTILAIGAVGPLIWPFLHDYQRQRVLTFLNPTNQDPLGAGYNLLQAQIAIGSGGLWGKGYLAGTQGHLGFLPARVTDFVFAVYGEEFGFVGGAVLVGLFLWLIWRLVRGAGRARDEFGTLLLVGIAGMFFFQAAVNVGMNLGVLPVVGIPLPFMSFGGSSMLTNMAAIGLAQSVLIRRRPLQF
ncbi:MAG: rod shape-determining protein RodA [Candidatus Dormibacteria bacterium]